LRRQEGAQASAGGAGHLLQSHPVDHLGRHGRFLLSRRARAIRVVAAPPPADDDARTQRAPLNNPPLPPSRQKKTQQIGVAVGCLAILDQRLRTVPVLYNGPDARFKGQTARVEYCLLSSSSSSLADAQPSRCSLATAAPATSLGLSVLWILVRGLARERAPGASPVPSIIGTRIAESAIAALGAGWWLAMGVVISLWTSQANAADPPLPGADWRNTMSFLYWLNFLLFLALMGTSVILTYLTKMRASGRVPPGGGWGGARGAQAAPAAAAAAAAPHAAPAAAVGAVPHVGGGAAAPVGVAAVPPPPAHTAVNVAAPAH
jgi:hypothetical protein